ncbi:HAMP domain-containing methyl-accepting chemotaxis protein [Anabaena catenula]|uniref:Methyl-accepting chemotaxis protein n=1 Tax=Anabaena catenula FACHB-362 TaxID=2692877 RepID=A0ABR8JB21_9NOST|nr:methyl-accepting chemotaxis protein [Anabaena catenula]MBD2694822.1 methyl-accepting chemotaxis protein [Anabaena catenula FACHB-362]
MLNNMSLQKRLIGAFLFIGAIVLVVSLMGWSVNIKLSSAINTLSTNSIPSIMGLWKINEGQTQIESSEKALLDQKLLITERNAEVVRIKQAWEQIDSGFKQYEPTEKNDDKKKLYEQLLSKWNEWKENHEKLLQINQQFEILGIVNPLDKELELIKQNKANSPEMELVNKAKVVYEQLRQQAKDNRPSFEAATKLLLEDIKLNESLGIATYKVGQQDAATGSFLMIIAVIIGPLTAIILGVVLSKPIVNQVEELVKISNNIATSNLTTQQSSEGKDEIAKLQTAFYTVAAKIAELVNVAQKISTGDLTMQIELSGHQDEIGKLQSAFYTMNKDLNSLIKSIQQSGVQITTSSTQIAASGKQLEATVTEQLASTHEVTATAQEIAATSRNLVKMG